VLERYNDVMHLRDIHAAATIPWPELDTYPQVGQDAADVPTEQ
jgi:hypothetical protein